MLALCDPEHQAGIKSLSGAESMAEKIIGIDLGTTNSVVAVMQGGGPVVIPNQEGGRATPAVVAITKNGGRVGGPVGKRQTGAKSENTGVSNKRVIGRRYQEGGEEARR